MKSKTDRGDTVFAAIEVGISELKAAVLGGNYKIIRQGIERLDQATRRFAELMMDSAVSGAMKGQTMAAAGASMGDGPTAPHPFAKAEINGAEITAPQQNLVTLGQQDPLTAEESTED